MKLKLAGILFLVIVSAFVVGSTVAVYNKAFVDSVPVTLKADRVGNQLRPGGEVKARGGGERSVPSTVPGLALRSISQWSQAKSTCCLGTCRRC